MAQLQRNLVFYQFTSMRGCGADMSSPSKALCYTSRSLRWMENAGWILGAYWTTAKIHRFLSIVWCSLLSFSVVYSRVAHEHFLLSCIGSPWYFQTLVLSSRCDAHTADVAFTGYVRGIGALRPSAVRGSYRAYWLITCTLPTVHSPCSSLSLLRLVLRTWRWCGWFYFGRASSRRDWGWGCPQAAPFPSVWPTVFESGDLRA